jgi:hypothetical protein
MGAVRGLATTPDLQGLSMERAIDQQRNLSVRGSSSRIAPS